MSETPVISGVLPVLHMPYETTGAIDLDTLAREVDHVFDSGADGIVLALASELLRLSTDERLMLTRELPKMAAKRGTVTISAGAETTREAIDYARAAEEAGADAVMAVPPFTTAVSAEEKASYYRAIHNAITIPLVVQDASGYMGGQAMSPELQASFRSDLGPRVYFKPEGSPTGPIISRMMELLGDNAVIFEGSGGSLLIDSMRRGVHGTMPGSDLIRGIVAVWRAMDEGDEERAYRIHLPLAMIISFMTPGLDAYLTIEKHLLFQQGVFRNTIVRGPVGFVLDDQTRDEVDRLHGMLEAAMGE
jgi:dihydrodipicolinate synthase/N-acetylneuraminate lyase